MKSSILLASLLAGMAACAAAQTNQAPVAPMTNAEIYRQRAIDFLPKTDQDRVLSAHSKALADDPDLKGQEDDLFPVHPAEASSTPGARQANMEKRRSFEQKVRQAMLKDAGIEPILDRIDKHLSELRAERAKAGTKPSPVGAP